MILSARDKNLAWPFMMLSTEDKNKLIFLQSIVDVSFTIGMEDMGWLYLRNSS